MKKSFELSFSGLKLTVVLADGKFWGIGGVVGEGVDLRDGSRPIRPLVETPDGRQAREFMWAGCQPCEEGGHTLTCRPIWEDSPRMEWMLHAVRNRRTTRDWTSTPSADSRTMMYMDVRPREVRIGKHVWRGFAYRYRYTGSTGSGKTIYQILDRATWEIGGVAVGNTIFMRGGGGPPVWTCRTADDAYSTEWYLPGTRNPNVFQFRPLQTAMQGFTFTSHPTGLLVTRTLKATHVRTLIEKPRDANAVFHWHEWCGDLAGEFTTPWMEILWIPGGYDDATVWNLYHDVFESTAEALHADAGLRRERVQSSCRIEQWGDADLALYRERGLEAVRTAGFRWVRLANHFANNMNVYGAANMCCNVDLRVPPTVGEDRLQAFCTAAHATGIRVEMWGNTAVSTLAWMMSRPSGRPKFSPPGGYESETIAVLRQAVDPFVRNPTGGVEADNYAPAFAVMNLRDETVRDHWRVRWRVAREKIGLDGIFLDSSWNLSSDKFHWRIVAGAASTSVPPAPENWYREARPAVEPPSAVLSMYAAHLSLVAEMQAMGYRYCGEDVGVFGVHASGPPVVARLDNLPMWPDCYARFDSRAIVAAGFDPHDIFFQGLAFRMVWMVEWHPETQQLSFAESPSREDPPSAWHCALLRLFDRLEPLMLERHIEPEWGAVRYRSAEGEQVIWVFKNGGWIPPRDAVVYDETVGRALAPGEQTLRNHVYRVAAVTVSSDRQVCALSRLPRGK